ncbi:MAG: helix-turn-helix transcriptional regulator, partial [Candidatus Zixiibacteriota bacterium]
AEISINSFNLSGQEVMGAIIHDISNLKDIEKSLNEKNIALREVLKQIEFEKGGIIGQVDVNIKRLIIPLLDELEILFGPESAGQISKIRKSLLEIRSPFVHQLKSQYARLTSREIQICDLIKKGKLSKEIAREFGLSVETIRSQRKSIRQKLGLAGEKVNLRTFLETRETI